MVAKRLVLEAVGEVRMVPSKVKPAFEVSVSASLQYVTRPLEPDPSMVLEVRQTPPMA